MSRHRHQRETHSCLHQLRSDWFNTFKSSSSQNRAELKPTLICWCDVMMTDVSLGQSDVPGPKGPAAVARIPGEGGERIGGGEEDR